ncbi:RapZ C-terminal domain-containing protein [Amycolatopsis anabasis]|uniref:RapZ C-terminal domain-containing protein n=1 Tax=Amycolatopsis anabasis TaxID=1840409 RepID=UPI003CCD86A1
MLTFTVNLLRWRDPDRRVVVQFGCACGRHRSVTAVEHVTRLLGFLGWRADTRHLDIDRPRLAGHGARRQQRRSGTGYRTIHWRVPRSRTRGIRHEGMFGCYRSGCPATPGPVVDDGTVVPSWADSNR